MVMSYSYSYVYMVTMAADIFPYYQFIDLN